MGAGVDASEVAAAGLAAMTTAGLVDAFCTWSAFGAVTDLCSELAPNAVPTWSEFAERVARAVVPA